MKILKQYLKLVREICGNGGGGALFLYVLCAAAGAVMPTVTAWSQKLFVAGLEKLSPCIAVAGFLGLYVVVKCFCSVYQYIDSYFAHKFIFKVKFIFNRRLTQKLYRESQERFYDPAFHDMLSRINQGMEKIPFQIFRINGIGIKVIVLLLVQFPLIIAYSPTLLLLVLSDSLFSLLFTRKLSGEQYELEQRLTRENRRASYFGGLFSSKSAAKEMRIFQTQDFFFRKWQDSYKQLNRTRDGFHIKKQRTQNFISMWNLFIGSGLLVILFYQLLHKRIDFGTFVFLYHIIPAVSEQVRDLIQSILGDGYVNYLTIEHYLDYVRTETQDIRDTAKDNTVDLLDFESLNFQSLEFENVSYRYPTGEKDAVQKVSFSIRRGEIVSILGYNGSGKTTLSRLATGLLTPTEGSIFLNGERLGSYDRDAVYSVFGIAYQDFMKYMLSLEDNIGFGYIERYGDENVRRALRDADGEALLAKLPAGFATRLGKEFYDDGIDLSGGEWQKIALARAYMGGHQLLLMDEPTAAVDPIKEMEMLKYFKSVLKGRTAVLISHRIGFARLADKVILMDGGRLVEAGSHEELIKNGGLYAKMFHAQRELYV